MDSTSYALVTAARNEQHYIEKTIKCVISQTCLPVKWVIVDDASADSTVEIVSRYASKYNFIELVKLSASGERNFSSQVKAQSTGYERVRHLNVEYIGFLDADMYFGSTYYEEVLRRFRQNRKLGLAGGYVFDLVGDEIIDSRKGSSSHHVPGGVQLFKRQCFEQIGGYIPLVWGGQDVVAEVMARMYGWEVRSFKEIVVLHLKPFGTREKSTLQGCIASGKKFYFIGYHPLYYLLSCARRIIQKPYIVGSMVSLGAFFLSYLCESERPVPSDFIRFLRLEQISRMKWYASKCWLTDE